MSGEKIAGAPVDHTPQSAAPVDPVATQPVAPVQPQQIELPTAPPIQVETVAAPQEPQERVDPPKPKPKGAEVAKKPSKARLDALEAKLEQEVQAMQEARAELQARAQMERDRARLAYLRDVGAVETLRDDHLLALAPDFDPTTADGRVELDRWREQNGNLFQGREMTGVQVAEEIVSNVPSSQYGTFGARLAKKIVSETFGG